MAYIMVTPSQLELMEVLKKHMNVSINTFELRNAGVASPSQRISEVRAKGAIIDVVMKSALDNSGKLRKNVAHYIYRGLRE